MGVMELELVCERRWRPKALDSEQNIVQWVEKNIHLDGGHGLVDAWTHGGVELEASRGL